MKKAMTHAWTVLAVVMLTALLSAVSDAECGGIKFSPSASIQSEQLGVQSIGSLLLVSAAGPSQQGIVGFWRVKLISENNPGIPDGTVLDAGFSQFHNDGTEILNSSRPPVTQSFCLGVWEKVGPSEYRLNHFALSWANGNLVGPANIRENLTLNRDHESFTGSFTLAQYDQTGNLLGQVGGKVEGKRITVNTSVSDVL